MKGLNVKKLAAIATGAALLGTAVAPIVSAITIQKSDIYSSDGTPKVNIIVGSKAAVSDGVWAGNLAAKIAEKAGATNKVAVALTGGENGESPTADIDLSDLTVDVTVGGGSVSFGAGSKEYKVTLMSASGSTEVVSNNDTNALTDAQLPHLFNKSISEKVDNGDQTSQTNNVTITEKVGVKVEAQFDTSTDVKDLSAYIEPNNFYYEVTLGSSGIDLGSTSFTDDSSDNVRVILFGEEYELNTAAIASSGTKNIKLVKATARESYNEGDLIEGLVGDGELKTEEVSVKVVQVVATGSASTSYKGTFQLLDSEGNVVDTRTVNVSENLRDVFKDSKQNYALSSNLFVDQIATGATTGIGYVEVTKGTDTLLLYDTKGYPYDSTDTTGIYDYVVTLTANDTNNLHKIKIANSRDKWNTSASSNGPLYPTKTGQSLTGKTGKAAAFGQALVDGTLGKGYAKVEFIGWEDNQEKSSVEFNKDLTGLDSSAHGGLYFRGQNDAEHKLPYSVELSQDTSGSTFTFDGKTIWYQQDFGADGSTSTSNDLNFMIVSGDVVNGRAWTLAEDHNAQHDTNIQVTVAGVGPIINTTGSNDANMAIGAVFEVDGVTYTLRDNNAITGTLSAIFSVDSKVTFRKNNSTGSLIYNTGAATTDTNTYGILYLSNNSVFDANASANLALPGNDDKVFSYAVKSYTTGSRLWLLLDADQIGGDIAWSSSAAPSLRGTDLIQNNKILRFRGTSYPSTTNYTELKIGDGNLLFNGDTGTGRTSMSGTRTIGVDTNAASYYVPQDPDYAGTSGAAGATGNAYYVAEFEVDDALVAGTSKVYIDTLTGGLIGPFTNANLSSYTADVDYNGSPAWTLKSGSESSNIKAAYSDAGTKAALLDSDAGARITMPEARENVQIVVYGTEVKRNVVGGETLTLKDGETKSTAGGVKITLKSVNGGSCSLAGGADGSAGACTATPDTYVSPVAIRRPLVFLDSDPTPSGTNIVVGGHIVNKLASKLSDRLASSGQTVAEVDAATGTIYVAGYTADDTGKAVKELIDAIDGLQVA